MQLLVAAGVEVNHPNKDGNTALTETFDDDAARALIAGGANVNLHNHDGETALIATVSESVAKILLEAGADPNVRDNEGKTALERAQERGWKDKVKVLRSATPVVR